jgi:hypothetical protein
MNAEAAEARAGFRFGLRWLFVLVALFAVIFGCYAWLERRVLQPSRQTAAIEKLLESLAARRPSGMAPRQWESAVAWTLNLHGNSLIRFQAEGHEIAAFQQRLASKLAGPVDMATIDWIWDEYAQVCPGGENYQRFRPMMIEEIEAGGADWSMNVR